MKFLVPNYSCLQNPFTGGYRPTPQIPVLSVLCPQLNLLNHLTPLPPEQNSWVRHCDGVSLMCGSVGKKYHAFLVTRVCSV